MAQQNFRGVYSTKESAYTGAGVAARPGVRKRYWLAWDREDDRVTVQPLNPNLIPSGAKQVVTGLEFAERFTREPDIMVDESKLDSGEAVAKKPAPKPPEIGFRYKEPVTGKPAPPPKAEPAPPSTPEEAEKRKTKLEKLEHDARSEFGLGLTYLKRGMRAKARRVFEELAEMQGEFEPEHKHMFNDFGVGLRKSRLFDVALKHYQRALELSENDENLHHNIARAYYELGDLNLAEDSLLKSLEINPNFKESRQFLSFLHKRKRRRSPLEL